MGYIKSFLRNISKKQAKKGAIIILGTLCFLSITAFANSSNLNFKKSNEFYYDLSYHYNKNNTNSDKEISIFPMNSYQNEFFGSTRNIEYTTDSSFYITQNDFERNKAIIKNEVNQELYTNINKKLLESAYNNLNPKKIAYLTFDDGPSKNTPKIIEILNKYNIKGTFFFLGKNMKQYPSTVKDVFEKGHSIGLHSYSHDYNKLYRTENGLIEDFNKAQSVYEEITNEKTNIIRLPYGSKPSLKKEHVEQLQENNYKFWDWNADSNDSNPNVKGKEGIIKTIDKIIKWDMNQLVILMHEKEKTVESLETTIKMLKDAGYVIKPINEGIDAHNYWGIK